MLFAEVPDHFHDLAFYLGVFLTAAGVATYLVRWSVNAMDLIIEKRLRPFSDTIENVRAELTVNGGNTLKDTVIRMRDNQNLFDERFLRMESRQEMMLEHFGLHDGLIAGPSSDDGPPPPAA